MRLCSLSMMVMPPPLSERLLVTSGFLINERRTQILCMLGCYEGDVLCVIGCVSSFGGGHQVDDERVFGGENTDFSAISEFPNFGDVWSVSQGLGTKLRPF